MYEFIFHVLITATCGLITFITASFTGNAYLRHYNNLILSSLLPVITIFITKAISTNLVLSLGMIGALSIVRYRTPVKSTFELGMLFFLITIGICAIVDFRMTFGLTLFVNLLLIIINFILKKKNFFGNYLSFINKNQTRYEVILELNKDTKSNILDEYEKYLRNFRMEKKSDDTIIKIYCYNLNNLDEVNRFKKLIVEIEGFQSFDAITNT
tara:strand:+ start:2167 stop:2802 length:636 start_codon:yes stop_codon:yes gene_type:complete